MRVKETLELQISSYCIIGEDFLPLNIYTETYINILVESFDSDLFFFHPQQLNLLNTNLKIKIKH